MPSASQIFNRIFTLTNIKEVYHDNIEFKATRGIDKVSLNQFNKHKEKEFKIIYNKCKKGTYKF